MGTDYALACGDCREFIVLHKWSILKYHSLPSQKLPSLSNQLLVLITAQQVANSLEYFVPHQPYIKELLPFSD